MGIDPKYAVDYNLSQLVKNEGKLDLSDRELTNAGIQHLASRVSGNRGKDNAEALSELNLHKSHLDDGCIPSLIRVMKEARHLTSLNISDNAFSGKGLAQLCKALEGHHGLKLLNIGTNPLDEEGAKGIASLIRSGSSRIEELQAHNASFGDAGMTAIAKAIAHSESPLTRINLASNEGKAEAGKAWAEAIMTHKSLTSVHLSQECEPFDEGVTKAFSKSRNPNLTYISPTNDATRIIIERNRAFARKAAEYLDEKPENLQYSQLALISQREPAAQRQTSGKMNSVIFKAANFSRYKRHMETLPSLPPVGEGFAEALFKPNASGYAPLDNPRNWENWDVVQKGLEASNAKPNQEFLQKTTPKGVDFLQSAAAVVPSTQIISYLLKQGGKLGSSELLNEDNTPSPLFRAFIERGDVGGIFAQENWIGKPKGELNAVYSALPENLQKSVPIHTLRQSTRPANQGLGR